MIQNHSSWDFKPFLEKASPTLIDSFLENPTSLIRNVSAQPLNLRQNTVCSVTNFTQTLKILHNQGWCRCWHFASLDKIVVNILLFLLNVPYLVIVVFCYVDFPKEHNLNLMSNMMHANYSPFLEVVLLGASVMQIKASLILPVLLLNSEHFGC